MSRLKNRNAWLPGGFQVLHPEAGMAQPFSGSFSECVSFESKFRRGNPHLVKKNSWSLDPSEIEWYVEQQNVARMVAHGWNQYLQETGSAVLPPVADAQKKTLLGNVAASVRTTKAAVHLYLDWLGDSGQPVVPALAEKRAAVCVACPKNKQGGLRNFFIEKVAKEIVAVFGIMNDMDLHTSQDEKLGVCEACTCPMKSKVWTPINHIRNHLTDDARANLDPKCWIPVEK